MKILSEISDNDISFIENILKELPSNIFLKDLDRKYVFSTHYWDHINVDKNDPNWNIKGKSDLEIRKDKENAKNADYIDQKIIETGVGVTYTIEYAEEGEKQFLEICKNPVFDDDGNVIGIVGQINDITERIMLKKRLEEIAYKDFLTGSYNRTYFNDWLTKYNDSDIYPLSFMMVDCNGLKQINDVLGHDVGDEYIKKTALLLNISSPDNAFTVRLGGDEFLLVLPTCNENVVNTLKNHIKSMCDMIKIKDAELSVAVGCVTINEYTDDIKSYLKDVDSKMYKDKVLCKKNRK